MVLRTEVGGKNPNPVVIFSESDVSRTTHHKCRALALASFLWVIQGLFTRARVSLFTRLPAISVRCSVNTLGSH